VSILSAHAAIADLDRSGKMPGTFWCIMRSAS
jgi:hypothetical protein